MYTSNVQDKGLSFLLLVILLILNVNYKRAKVKLRSSVNGDVVNGAGTSTLILECTQSDKSVLTNAQLAGISCLLGIFVIIVFVSVFFRQATHEKIIAKRNEQLRNKTVKIYYGACSALY